VQAQEFGVAKWSIAQRSRGQVTSADLDRALAERRILRTHVLRSTWHFVLPADLRWMLMLIGPRVRARMKSGEDLRPLIDVMEPHAYSLERPPGPEWS
jgi:hypothetical protein